MEEYKDSLQTLKVLITTLSKPEFQGYTAGIAIQAYLADAWELQTELSTERYPYNGSGADPRQEPPVSGGPSLGFHAERSGYRTFPPTDAGWKES